MRAKTFQQADLLHQKNNYVPKEKNIEAIKIIVKCFNLINFTPPKGTHIGSKKHTNWMGRQSCLKLHLHVPSSISSLEVYFESVFQNCIFWKWIFRKIQKGILQDLYCRFPKVFLSPTLFSGRWLGAQYPKNIGILLRTLPELLFGHALGKGDKNWISRCLS